MLAERVFAGAASASVRVVDRDNLLLDGVFEIDCGAIHVGNTYLIDHHVDTVEVNPRVSVEDLLIQRESWHVSPEHPPSRTATLRRRSSRSCSYRPARKLILPAVRFRVRAAIGWVVVLAGVTYFAAAGRILGALLVAAGLAVVYRLWKREPRPVILKHRPIAPPRSNVKPVPSPAAGTTSAPARDEDPSDKPPEFQRRPAR